MTSKNAKTEEKTVSKVPVKSRDAVETAITLSKRSNTSTWEMRPVADGRYDSWTDLANNVFADSTRP